METIPNQILHSRIRKNPSKNKNVDTYHQIFDHAGPKY